MSDERVRDAVDEGLDRRLDELTRALREATLDEAGAGEDATPGGAAGRERVAGEARGDEAEEARAEGARPPDATLARIERTLGTRRRATRRFARFVAVPLAAALLVLTAWASASGNLRRWLAPAMGLDGERQHDERATAGSAAAQGRSLRAPAAASTTAAAAPLPEPETPPDSNIATPTPSPSSSPSPEPAPARSAERAAPRAPSPARVDADALYREAHDAHFVRRDYAAAVVAWDRYLAAAGAGGRFALEARYNRAIALARLGRRSEAADALRPFARGDYGGYRRDEARELLRTLDTTP
jgi:hypothetical protein